MFCDENVLYLSSCMMYVYFNCYSCLFIRRKQLPVESVPIITKVVSSNPAHCEVYSIQYYVIKFVSDLREVGGFLQALRFPPPINMTSTK